MRGSRVGREVHMKKILSAILAAAVIISCAGCSKSSEKTRKRRKTKKPTKIETSATTTTEIETEPTDASDPSDSSDPTGSSNPSRKNASIIDMDLFITNAGNELSDDNEIREIIAEKTGVCLHEIYLVGQSVDEALNAIIASGEYPDMIYTGSSDLLYQVGALIAWDDYIADPAYQNLRDFYTDAQWELFREDDGHIYCVDPYPMIYGEDRTTIDTSLTCFWIQVRVLEWAGYPLIQTMDEYFDLLERYYNENPKNEDGTDIIPYTMNTDGWRNYCLEAVPQLLDGYAYNGTVIVDTEKYSVPTILDYNTTPTARRYFQRLNEFYKKGLLDPDFGAHTYDEYIAKMSSGAVLGTFDSYWDFTYYTDDSFKSNDLEKYGYNYVPLGLTIEKGMENHYHSNARLINQEGGLTITTQCEDPALAFSFLNRCLDQDIHDLRFWGVEETDYYVDGRGYYYRTAENNRDWSDYSYLAEHVCRYDYLPSYKGTSRDNINAMQPQEQASIFLDTLPQYVSKCFMAYGYDSYCDFVRSSESDWEPWYPMYTYSNSMTAATKGGEAFYKIKETKQEYLPKVVLAKDFDAVWDEYMEAYSNCHPKDFLDEMQEELDRRAALAG